MLNYFKSSLLVALLLLAFLNSLALAQRSVSYPNYQNIYVNDYANLLDSDLEETLRQYLKQAGRNAGPQISLITISSLAEYGAGPEIEPFATRLFNHWGVGNADSNDGVLIIVSNRDRKMRIELGSGYSSYSDRDMKDVIDNYFIPYFKNDDYKTGIKVGTIETIYRITKKYPGELGDSIVSRTKYRITRLIEKAGAWIIAILAPVFLLIFVAVRKVSRLRPRRCDACDNQMTMLDEKADDEHLDGGQRLEEYLKSIDYDVWQCGACSRIDIYRYKNFFSSLSSCESCGYKTLSADSTVIRSATTSASGLKRIDYHCKNCDFRDSETRTIPKKSESSSSGFGGGRSSGGGASGSW